MKNAPLISVVLPVYNVASYIKEAVDSILNQSIQDFEIIIIDDCSTDNTIAIVESFKDGRIRIIKKTKNKGLVDSLNIGFSEAKGTYIARMDGDDINVLNRFEKQLKILKSNIDIKACGCWLQCFGASEKIIKHKEFQNEIQAKLLLNNSMSLGGTMLEKDAYKNFKFDEAKLHVEDYDFWARTAWECKPYNIQEVLYLYRVHEKQVSTVYNQFQKDHDINIKLSLFHKLNYNKSIFNDLLVRKLLFDVKELKAKECVLLFKWFNELITSNNKQRVFGKKEFLDIINILRRRFVFEIFFTKNIKELNYESRKDFLFTLPIKEMIYVVFKKIKEKLFVLKKTNKG